MWWQIRNVRPQTTSRQLGIHTNGNMSGLISRKMNSRIGNRPSQPTSEKKKCI
jgi:hypothetical protein